MDSSLDAEGMAPLHPSMLHGLMGGYVYYDHVVRLPITAITSRNSHHFKNRWQKPRALQEGLGFPGRAPAAASCLDNETRPPLTPPAPGLGPAAARMRCAAEMSGARGVLAFAPGVSMQPPKLPARLR